MTDTTNPAPLCDVRSQTGAQCIKTAGHRQNNEPHIFPVPLTPEREADIRDRVAAGLPGHNATRTVLAELDRVRAERDAFADRVDTLTAVAKSNKQHAQEMYAELQKAHREREELVEQHKSGLRRADELNNSLMAEVQRYAEGTERPVLWSVYNRMHHRALNAEAEAKRLRAELEASGAVVCDAEGCAIPHTPGCERAAALAEGSDH
ncbi:hypothetical protein [Streptomyces sp. DASNCL29]|uniref:hypothetical protein n=1 Tax=Streptomyces sp. DASNCL29 TaxID=2583819 RepID=UPI00110FCE18|nr:hypothetical protein [Streptomyces sp. DASNCL29]TMU98073.1 hypothetical protein FGK60_09575 [Streptomyces sp. DASNCL29]